RAGHRGSVHLHIKVGRARMIRHGRDNPNTWPTAVKSLAEAREGGKKEIVSTKPARLPRAVAGRKRPGRRPANLSKRGDRYAFRISRRKIHRPAIVPGRTNTQRPPLQGVPNAILLRT